jgi:hypothetical protein
MSALLSRGFFVLIPKVNFILIPYVGDFGEYPEYHTSAFDTPLALLSLV